MLNNYWKNLVIIIFENNIDRMKIPHHNYWGGGGIILEVFLASIALTYVKSSSQVSPLG